MTLTDLETTALYQIFEQPMEELDRHHGAFVDSHNLRFPKPSQIILRTVCPASLGTIFMVSYHITWARILGRTVISNQLINLHKLSFVLCVQQVLAQFLW